jgi:hypothetical protein
MRRGSPVGCAIVCYLVFCVILISYGFFVSVSDVEHEFADDSLVLSRVLDL